MAIKPGVLCTLRKDKLIDTQNGFVDTFNWVVSAVNNLKGGENCEVNWTAPDIPQIEVNSEPFKPSEDSGSGNVDFKGTTGQTDSASSFTFESASNSNVQVTCNGTTITIGVYYI